MHQLFDPDDTKTWTILSTLGVDPVYQRMCHLQKCFRARLTPKPWRIAIGATIPKGRVVWRSEYMKDADRLAWVNEYDMLSADYAVCDLIKQYGNRNKVINPKIQSVLELHDQYTKVDQQLPLA